MDAWDYASFQFLFICAEQSLALHGLLEMTYCKRHFEVMKYIFSNKKYDQHSRNAFLILCAKLGQVWVIRGKMRGLLAGCRSAWHVLFRIWIILSQPWEHHHYTPTGCCYALRTYEICLQFLEKCQLRGQFTGSNFQRIFFKLREGNDANQPSYEVKQGWKNDWIKKWFVWTNQKIKIWNSVVGILKIPRKQLLRL